MTDGLLRDSRPRLTPFPRLVARAVERTPWLGSLLFLTLSGIAGCGTTVNIDGDVINNTIAGSGCVVERGSQREVEGEGQGQGQAAPIAGAGAARGAYAQVFASTADCTEREAEDGATP